MPDADLSMTVDKQTAAEVRTALERAQWQLYESLDVAYGSFKRAPDDHEVFKIVPKPSATTAISKRRPVSPSRGKSLATMGR
jgi:hypothetical protein